MTFKENIFFQDIQGQTFFPGYMHTIWLIGEVQAKSRIWYSERRYEYFVVDFDGQ